MNLVYERTPAAVKFCRKLNHFLFFIEQKKLRDKESFLLRILIYL